MMINDVINNYSLQQHSMTTLYHIESQKLMLRKTATWNDMKYQRSKIVFNAQYATTISDTFCICGSMIQAIAEEVKKQAEH